MNVRHRAAARRYARALLDVALDRGRADELRQELRQASELLAEQPELLAALTHPAVSIDRKRPLVRELWNRLGGSELLVRLLDLLTTRGRLDLLPDIEQAFAADWNAQRGVLLAEAVTADALTEAQQEHLANALAAASGQKIEIQTAVTPSVLGGVRVTMGGRIYDGTVRGRLQSMRRHLEGNR